MCRTHNSAILTQGQDHTIEGHQFEPWILRPLHCHSERLVKFGSNVCLSEMMCRTYNSRSRSQLKVIHLFLVHSISPEPFERFSWNFGQMFALVRQCVEPITQACWLKVKVTVKGHEFEPWISCSLHPPEPFERCSLNLGQMLALVRWCAEPIIQQCRFKVKVTIEGHQFEPWILRPLHCHFAAGDIAVLQTALFKWLCAIEQDGHHAHIW